MNSLRTLAQRLHVNLWSLVIAPAVWAIHFLACYAVAAIHCARAGRAAELDGVRTMVTVATVLALVLVGISTYVAWAHTRIEGDPPPHQQSTDEDRARFLGMAKLLLCGLSFVAIVFTAIPAFLFEDCR
jgi:hypothetical protein